MTQADIDRHDSDEEFRWWKGCLFGLLVSVPAWRYGGPVLWHWLRNAL